MDIFIKDNNTMDTVAILDTFKSLIWTERYASYGDFELYTFVDKDLISCVTKDRYLVLNKSDRGMIVEDILIDTEVEDGSFVTISGRSLESILTRRIVWGQTIVSGNLQDAVRVLLNNNVISPTDPDRKIDNFIFEESTDPAILGITVDAQFTGDELYEAIKSLCDAHDIGFKVVLNDSNQFVFSLYSGKDRTYNQTENPYVIFSPKFDNMISSRYLTSKKSLKNVTLVAGEGEGADRRTVTVGSARGLSRREIFTDAKDVSSTVDNGTLSDEEYSAQLEQRGLTKLAENIEVESFDAEVDATVMFRYGEHFFMGDIVQISNEYGNEGTARVTELIRSESEEGINVYPTFNMIEQEEET